MLQIQENKDDDNIYCVDILEDGELLASIYQNSIFEDIQNLILNLGEEYQAFDLDQELVSSYEQDIMEEPFDDEELTVPLTDIFIDEDVKIKY